MAAVLGLCHSASAGIASVPDSGSVTVEFSDAHPMADAYALIVMHGSVGTGYYLDDPIAQGAPAGTGGLVSLGPVLPVGGVFTATVNYQYAPYETPVGVIIAGVDPGLNLEVGVSGAFLAEPPNSLWLSSTASFATATATLSGTEPEGTVVSNILGGTPYLGDDFFLNNLGNLALPQSAFIPFAANSTGTLVDFPQLDGNSVGMITVNPSAVTPLPAPLWAGLVGFAGLASLKLGRKRNAIAAR
jgi:hypothetical protein